MRPIQTDTTNIILTLEDCGGLPATVMQCFGGRQEFETCWQLDPEDLATVQRTGRVYLIVAGREHPPVALAAESVLE